jgi:hypothetical protein
MTTTPEPVSGVLVLVADPLFTVGERQALAGFLSGYRGLTRDAYILDLPARPAHRPQSRPGHR